MNVRRIRIPTEKLLWRSGDPHPVILIPAVPSTVDIECLNTQCFTNKIQINSRMIQYGTPKKCFIWEQLCDVKHMFRYTVGVGTHSGFEWLKVVWILNGSDFEFHSKTRTARPFQIWPTSRIPIYWFFFWMAGSIAIAMVLIILIPNHPNSEHQNFQILKGFWIRMFGFGSPTVELFYFLEPEKRIEYFFRFWLPRSSCRDFSKILTIDRGARFSRG